MNKVEPDEPEFFVRCSYVQVYLDECYDLLATSREHKSNWGSRTNNVNRLRNEREELKKNGNNNKYPYNNNNNNYNNNYNYNNDSDHDSLAEDNNSTNDPELAFHDHKISSTASVSSSSFSNLPKLEIRELDGVPFLQNLKEEICTSSYDMLSLLKKGAQRKAIAHTRMNLRSSRSHTIFTVIVEQNLKTRVNGTVFSSSARLVS